MDIASFITQMTTENLKSKLQYHSAIQDQCSEKQRLVFLASYQNQ